MSDITTAILDAAELRMRQGGFSGFSFRDIATDVGVKSSSVHYHFPTKEKLAEAVIRRFTLDVSDHIDEMRLTEHDPVRLWTTTFRGTLTSPERMCPCSVLAATALDLPTGLVAAVQDFFKMCHTKMVEQGMDSASADLLLATITGAQLISNAMGSPDTFDRVVAERMRAHTATAPALQPV